MTAIDPRIAARRQEVKEQGARHRLRWMLLAVLGLGIVLGSWWVVQSPFMAVESIVVIGAERAAIPVALDAAGLNEGMSVVWVRTGRIEDALLADPWIRDARVEIDFPHIVEVSVLEHAPFAAAVEAGAWRLLAADGAVLAVTEDPPELGIIEGGTTGAPGAVVADVRTQAALGFLAGLTDTQRADARVVVADSAMLAYVEGTTVLLGTGRDIAAKAAATVSLIAAGVDEGWSLDVTAPSRPALVPPVLPALPEALDEAATEALPEGQGG